jgi:hypothetical protein
VIFLDDLDRVLNEEWRRLEAGFVKIAKLYFERFKKTVRFYPVAVNKKKKLMKIGEPVCYKPQAPYRDEKKRILLEIENRVTALYADIEKCSRKSA